MPLVTAAAWLAIHHATLLLDESHQQGRSDTLLRHEQAGRTAMAGERALCAHSSG
jgi:hypothetical protein